jgi:hypothetical protein
VPEQEQAGANHDRGAGDQCERRYIAPENKSKCGRPDKHEITKRADGRRWRERQRTRLPVLSDGIDDAITDHRDRVSGAWPGEKNGSGNAKNTVRKIV